MDSIEKILEKAGVTVTDEQKAAIVADVGKNYRTVTDYDRQTKKLETAEADRENLKNQLADAQETLKGFDGVDVEGFKLKISELEKRAETAEKDYAAKIAQRDFEDALKEEIGGYKFTSEAAKKAIMTEIRESGLKVKDGKILGLSDLIAQMKEKDASAFVDEKQEELEAGRAKPFTMPLNGKQPMTSSEKFKDMSLDERMKLKASDPAAYERLRKGE